MLTISESISLKLISKEKLLHGLGDEIRISDKNGTRRLDWKFPRKIHGIEFHESGEGLIFGEKYFTLFRNEKNDVNPFYEGRISDWISSAQLNNGEFYLLTAHSVLLRCKMDDSLQSVRVMEKMSCSDKSTLYCSLILKNDWEKLTIFGGNAFGEIIIWEPNRVNIEDQYCPVLKRLRGHDGVIFSINVNLKHNLMTTTSDDRSVRLWKVDFSEREIKDWKSVTLKPYKSSYSHTARVFQGKILENDNKPYVISCGEDSCLCLWDEHGNLVKKIERTVGAFLNCEYCSETKTIYASSSSGKVIKYHIEDLLTPLNVKEVKFLFSGSSDAKTYLAKVKFLKDDILVGLTNQNHLVFHQNESWEVIGRIDFKATVFQVFNDKMIVIAGYEQLLVYEFNDEGKTFVKAFGNCVVPGGIIRSVHQFYSENEFLVCSDKGQCKYTENKFSIFSHDFTLPQMKEPWITAASKIENYFVISNRQGNLYLYKKSENSFELKTTLKHLHGYLGVTKIILGNIMNNDQCTVKTCGHDKTFKEIEIDKTTDTMKITKTETVPLAWVENTIPFEDKFFLAGFNDNHFIVWERTLDEFLLKVPCGGGHRCWDLKMNFVQNNMDLIFIKNKRLFLLNSPIKNKSLSPICIRNHSWHVKYCNILKVFTAFSNNDEKLILVSGGEDNLLKFSSINLNSSSVDKDLTLLNEMHLHISSIRTIDIWRLPNQNKYLIFSAGGRAQICVTCFDLDNFKIEEKCNFMLKSNDFERKYFRNPQEIDFDPETRIMSVKIAAAESENEEFIIIAGCSDGFIRNFSYNHDKITLIDEFNYNRCILHVDILNDENLKRKYLTVASTDGKLSFWNVENFKKFFLCPPSFTLNHHESGINSLSINNSIKDQLLNIVTGGDDQTLVISEINSSEKETYFSVDKTTTLNAIHTAQINGVRISSNRKYLYSTGCEQMVYKIDLSNFNIVTSEFTCIPDCKGLELYNFRGEDYCIIYGPGIQIIKL